MLALLEAARWASSSFSDQPWRFIVCDKAVAEAAWQRALATLSERSRQWAKNVPVLVLSVAMDNFNHNGQPNRSTMYDTGAASLKPVGRLPADGDDGCRLPGRY
jgi:nitroreductase